ncbi:MAG: riboflavin biosynthesis protein RibF [Chloroflexota bacterium]
MRVVRSLAELTPGRPTAVTIGAFDGVHLGHQFLFRELRESAARLDAATLAITFDPDPADVVSSRPTRHLSTLDERIELIGRQGLDEMCVVHFDHQVAALTAEQFMDVMLRRVCLVQLLVGYDFAMGHDRQGTKGVLAGYAERHGFGLFTSEAFMVGGTPVSSSRIRRLLEDGAVEAAAELLGRAPSIRGPVVPGDRRGRTIGFPTANIGLRIRWAMPADGVYVARTGVRGQALPSVVNIGLRPTFDRDQRTLESHILDFDQDIYGETVSVEFLHRLRGEQKFSGVDAIREQITQDARQAREYFATAA